MKLVTLLLVGVLAGAGGGFSAGAWSLRELRADLASRPPVAILDVEAVGSRQSGGHFDGRLDLGEHACARYLPRTVEELLDRLALASVHCLYSDGEYHEQHARKTIYEHGDLRGGSSDVDAMRSDSGLTVSSPAANTGSMKVSSAEMIWSANAAGRRAKSGRPEKSTHAARQPGEGPWTPLSAERTLDCVMYEVNCVIV